MELDLPDLVQFCGDWESYENAIYEIYLDEIVRGQLKFCNLPVRTRHTPKTKEKHFGFWHIISEGQVEEDRLPDLDRCRRIRWIKWVIENHQACSDVSFWAEKMRGKNEVVLWIEKEQYVVVLSERRDAWLLKTSYLATRSGKIRQLKRNREKYATPK